MSSVHRPAPEGPMLYACAQAGCQACVERLLPSMQDWCIGSSGVTATATCRIRNCCTKGRSPVAGHPALRSGARRGLFDLCRARHPPSCVGCRGTGATPAGLSGADCGARIRPPRPRKPGNAKPCAPPCRSCWPVCRNAPTTSWWQPTVWTASRRSVWPPSAGCTASAANTCAKSAMTPWCCCGYRRYPAGCAACVITAIEPPTSGPTP